jgi:hypothetical protein
MSSFIDRLNIYSVAVKVPCRAATSANVTLAGFQTVDGIAITSSDANKRVLVKDQDDATENGIYNVDSGAWTRVRDFDHDQEVVNGSRVYVASGSTEYGDYVVVATDPIVVGQSEITFSLVTPSGLADHLADTADAHDASAISVLDAGNNYAATNVETALAEVYDALEVDVAALAAHIADGTAAHAASAISYDGGTGISAANVEAALDELATEKLDASSYTAADVLAKLLTVDGAGSLLDADLLDGNSSAFYATASSVSDHLADASAAHAASAISFSAAGGLSSTDVQAAIAELDTEKQPLDSDLTTLAGLTRTRGDLIVGGASAWTDLAIGTSGYALLSDGTDAAWAGFVPAGSGASTRTWQAKARDVISVKDFGALGDNSNDDTAEIQAAIDAAQSAGAALHFPAGTYKINGTLTITEPLDLYGDGARRTIIRQTHATANVVYFNYATLKLGGGLHDMSIEAGAGWLTGGFQGTGTTGVGLAIFNVLTAFVVENFQIANCGYGITIDSTGGNAGSWGIFINNFHILYCASFGIRIAASGDPGGQRWITNGQISNNGFTGTNTSSVGMRWFQSGGDYVRAVDVTSFNEGIVLAPESGQGAVAYLFMDTLVGDTCVAAGWSIVGTHAPIIGCSFVNCWGAYTSAGPGLTMDGASTNVNALHFTNFKARENDGSGIVINRGSNISFTDVHCAQNGQDADNTLPGVQINANAGNVSFFGGRIGNFASVLPNDQADGINVHASFAGRLIVNGVDFTDPGSGKVGILNNSATVLFTTNNVPETINNHWGSGTFTGGLNVGFDGTIVADRLNVGSTSFGLWGDNAAYPLVSFDANDFYAYDIGANEHQIVVGGVVVAKVTASALQAGVAGTNLGTLNLAGNTSGTISVKPQAAAGTFNFNLPTTAGTSGYLLTSAGGGSSPMTWINPTSVVPTAVTVADTTDSSCSVALFESATGDLGPKTDAGLAYNASTGALTAGSLAVTSAPSAAWTVLSSTAASAVVTVANDGTYDIATGSGVLVISGSDAASAIFFLWYGSSNIVYQDGSNLYSNTLDTGSKTNVYYNAGTGKYRIQNKTGSSRDYHMMPLQTRNAA